MTRQILARMMLSLGVLLATGAAASAHEEGYGRYGYRADRVNRYLHAYGIPHAHEDGYGGYRRSYDTRHEYVHEEGISHGGLNHYLHDRGIPHYHGYYD